MSDSINTDSSLDTSESISNNTNSESYSNSYNSNDSISYNSNNSDNSETHSSDSETHSNEETSETSNNEISNKSPNEILLNTSTDNDSISVPDISSGTVGSETPSEELIIKKPEKDIKINISKEKSEKTEPSIDLLKPENCDLRESTLLRQSLEDPLTFEKFEDPVITPCNHIFDRESITEWLDSDQSTCPLCRTEILKKHLQPHNPTRVKLGLEEVSIHEPSDSSTSANSTPILRDNNEAEIQIDDMSEYDYTCCGTDHSEYCSKCFCVCARKIENDDEATICWDLFCCSYFSLHSLGSESSERSRTIWGLCYPFWLLFILIGFIIEIFGRICVLIIGIIVIIIAIFFIISIIGIIVFIVLILAIILIILVIIGCIIQFPCILVACCCRCCLAWLDLAAQA